MAPPATRSLAELPVLTGITVLRGPPRVAAHATRSQAGRTAELRKSLASQAISSHAGRMAELRGTRRGVEPTAGKRGTPGQETGPAGEVPCSGAATVVLLCEGTAAIEPKVEARVDTAPHVQMRSLLAMAAGALQDFSEV